MIYTFIFMLLINTIHLSSFKTNMCLAPDSIFNEEPQTPLELEDGSPIERPATYDWDQDMWKTLESANPGITLKVKRVLATYFDKESENILPNQAKRNPLRPGVDYDDIVGRSVWIKLQHPVVINGYIMHYLILKGAAFQYQERDKTFTNPNIKDETGELFGHIEFDAQGKAFFKPTPKERWNALKFEWASNEYKIGRHAFFNESSNVNILPIMKVRYLDEKDLAGDSLGVVVHASPLVDAIDDQFSNRVGHLFQVIMLSLRTKQITFEQAQWDIQLYFYKFGEALRKFHDSGYVHGNPHSGNFTIVVDNPEPVLHTVDFSETKLKTELTRLQAFGYQLRDITYNITDTIEALNKETDPQAQKIFQKVLFYFLYGYLGAEALTFVMNDQRQFVHEIVMLHKSFVPLIQDPHGLNHLIQTNMLVNILFRIFSDSGWAQHIDRMMRPQLMSMIFRDPPAMQNLEIAA